MASFPASDWTRVPNTCRYHAASSHTALLRVEVWRRAGTTIGITVRLYNVTEDTVAMETDEITTETAYTEAAVDGAITEDHVYELQFKVTTGSGSGAYVNGAQLEDVA